jgi:hypothetical protein
MKYQKVARSMIALISSLALVVGTAGAKPDNDKGKGNGGGNGQSQKGGKAQKGKGKPDQANKGNAANDKNGKDFKTDSIVRFRDDERRGILDYFSGYRANEGGLPPGLAKNLRRGKPLPPGWEKKMVPGYRIEDSLWPAFTPVPYDLFPNVRAEPNTRLYMHGDRMVRVYEPRREILDVIVVPTVRY